MEHPPLIGEIPSFAQPHFHDVGRSILTKHVLAHQHDPLAVSRNLPTAVSLLQQLVALPKSHHGGRSGGYQLHRHFEAVRRQAAAVAAAVDEKQEADAAALVAVDDDDMEPPRQQQQLSEEDRLARRVAKLASQKHFGKIAQVAESHGVAQYSADVHRKAEELFPRRDPNNILPLAPADDLPPPLLHLDRSLLLRCIKRCDNGAGAGPTGLNGHHWRLLAEDATCLAAIEVLVRIIINGQLDRAASSLLLTTRLIPLYKNAERTDIRPIGVPESLLRIAGHYGLHSVLPSELQRIFVETSRLPQLGVGTRGGVESAIHFISSALDVAAVDGGGDDTILLSIDMGNGYGSVRRDACLRALYEHKELRPLWRYVRWRFEHDSEFVFTDARQNNKLLGIVKQQEGLTQGDVLAPLLFSLAQHSLLQSKQEQYPQLAGAAYIDDITQVGPINAALAWLQELEQDLPVVVGPRVKRSKCVAYWPGAPPTDTPRFQQVAARFQQLGIPLEHPGSQAAGVRLLGGWIGAAAGGQRLLDDRVARVRRTLSLLQSSLVPAQLSLHILRLVVLPQMTFAQRVMPPRITQAASATLDADILELARHKLKLPPAHLLPIRDQQPPHAGQPLPRAFAREELQLPLRFGGFGLTALATQATMAFYASVAASMRFVASQLHRWRRSHRPALLARTSDTAALTQSTLLRDVEQSVVELRTLQLPDNDLLRTGADFVDHFAQQRGGALNAAGRPLPAAAAMARPEVRLQHSLASLFSRGLFASLTDRRYRSATDIARLHHHAQPSARRWKTVVPSSSQPHLRLTDSQMSAAVHLALGLHLSPHPPRRCPRCQNADPGPDHALTCKAKAGFSILRHDQLNHVVIKHAQRAGRAVLREPLFRDVQPLVRPHPQHAAIVQQQQQQPAAAAADDDEGDDAEPHIPRNQRRLDALIYMPQSVVGTDISVVHGWSSSLLARPPASVLRDRHRVKLKHFGGQVLPLVLSSAGALHDDFVEFTRELASSYVDRLPQPDDSAYQQFRGNLLDELAITLQRIQAQALLASAASQ